LTVLIPLLRLADNMVRGPERRIESLTCRVQNGEVTLLVHSTGDIDLEQWGAERAAGTFQQVFNRTLYAGAGAMIQGARESWRVS